MILPSPFHPFMRLTDTSAAAAAIRKSSEADDYKLSFKYRCDDTSNASYQLYAMLRYADGNNYHILAIRPGLISLQQKAGGSWSSAITKSVSTAQGTWYDVEVICDGSMIEVWRGEERLLQSPGLTGLAGIRIRLGISADAAYSVDDFDLKAVDGAIYTYAYNDANELTAMNLDGVETHYTYDDWGRTASKYVGDGSVLHAEYGYRYGDKLKQVNSTFPGEEDEVHFIHDGLGKRRMKQVHGESNPAMEREWYRYDAGWNVVGQYADDPAGFWDIGGLEATAVWHGMTPLAEVAGSTPNGTYRHTTHDHLGSTRSLFDASKHAVGTIEYTPYGFPLVTAGITPEYTFTGKPFDAEVGMYYSLIGYVAVNTNKSLMRSELDEPRDLAAAVTGLPWKCTPMKSDILCLLKGCLPSTYGDGCEVCCCPVKPDPCDRCIKAYLARLARCEVNPYPACEIKARNKFVACWQREGCFGPAPTS